MSSLFSVSPFLLALQYHICQTFDIILWVPEALFLFLFFFPLPFLHLQKG